MVNVFIFYDSKYGNTKLAAEKVAEGIRAVGVAVDLGYVKETLPATADNYDTILFGAPNHMASPSRAMRNFINQLVKVELKARFVSVFGTYAGRERPQDRAERKLETIVQTKLPKLKLLSPGLSIHVHGVSGPVFECEVPKCIEFGRKLAQQVSEF
jgi:flavorubredoxin